MRYKEHRPNYVTGYEAKEIEFTSLDELKNSDMVVGRFFKGDRFYRFTLGGQSYQPALPAPDGFQGYLMAEMKCGDYWVAGYLYGTDAEIKALNLPKWVDNS
jgi:hypothetical protein